MHAYIDGNPDRSRRKKKIEAMTSAGNSSFVCALYSNCVITLQPQPCDAMRCNAVQCDTVQGH